MQIDIKKWNNENMFISDQTHMLEALSIYDLDHEDSLIQLEAEYIASTNVVLRVGADLFFGDRVGTFGRFREQSRLVTGFTLVF